jgi:hypothetical protein
MTKRAELGHEPRYRSVRRMSAYSRAPPGQCISSPAAYLFGIVSDLTAAAAASWLLLQKPVDRALNDLLHLGRRRWYLIQRPPWRLPLRLPTTTRLESPPVRNPGSSPSRHLSRSGLITGSRRPALSRRSARSPGQRRTAAACPRQKAEAKLNKEAAR